MKRAKKISATRYKRDVLTPKMTLENLRHEVEKEVTDVNAMLKSLKRTSKKLSYSARKLKANLSEDKLSAWNGKKNIVRLKANLSKQQLINIDKMLKRFKESKTSTKAGIKSLVKSKRQSLIEQTDNKAFVDNLTDKEINKLYSAFDDPDYKDVADLVDPSDLFYLSISAKTTDMSLTDFRKELESYGASSKDPELKESIKKIYDKYIRE